MTASYFTDGRVTLYLGDCREVTEWLAADVLVTDPPYGRQDRKGAPGRPWDRGVRIQGDQDTCLRDGVLAAWGKRPACVFGDLRVPLPAGTGQVLIYEKAGDAGWRSTAGFRRDAEAIYLIGLPATYGGRGSVLRSGNPGAAFMAKRHGHPHAKPVDVMETLISACPPGVVADPFAGSGSALVAARNQGRAAIGVEIDERYCEMAARRLSQTCLEMT